MRSFKLSWTIALICLLLVGFGCSQQSLVQRQTVCVSHAGIYDHSFADGPCLGDWQELPKDAFGYYDPESAVENLIDCSENAIKSINCFVMFSYQLPNNLDNHGDYQVAIEDFPYSMDMVIINPPTPVCFSEDSTQCINMLQILTQSLTATRWLLHHQYSLNLILTRK
ncbi:MAG: hypothetical protein PHS07_03540 [Patescibacteria group bacterium]|nr:hypothetical protein [Patescibacteria group bacterium]